MVATLNVTVPLLVPGLPPVTASHDALVTAVQDTFAVTPMDRPLAAELDTFVLDGLMTSAAAAPACTTVQVRVMPPPATTTPPVRAVVPALVATLNVTVPLLVSELPPVTASHDALVTAVHATFAVTPMDRPLAAELDTFVLDGLMVSDAGVEPTVNVRDIWLSPSSVSEMMLSGSILNKSV